MFQPTNDQIASFAGRRSSPGIVVSCLMLTARRETCAPIAISCFQNQTWPDRELVVVYDAWDMPTTQLLAPLHSDSRVRLVRNDRHRPTVGYLRNLAVSAATGTYCIQWDDDDAFHPERISRQMEELRRSGKPGCVLDSRICHVPSCQFMFESAHTVCEGTALIATDILRRYPYPNITRVVRDGVEVGEDTIVIFRLYKAGMLHIFHCPELYLYCIHTTNACSNAHIQTLYDKSQTNKQAQYSRDSATYGRMLRLTQPRETATLNKNHNDRDDESKPNDKATSIDSGDDEKDDRDVELDKRSEACRSPTRLK